MTIRDLTDPAQGRHAVQLVADAIESDLSDAWGIPVRRDSGPHAVSISDNYDRLGYDADAVTRDRRYSRYIDDTTMLRSHTTARIPALLDELAGNRGPADVLLSVPGMCYRRDVIGRYHVGEPHQHDLWRIRLAGPPLADADLVEMIHLILNRLLPGATVDTPDSPHPYTVAGREIYADGVEVGECGLARPEVLWAAGLPDTATGLAMGLGLDRLTMLVKGIPDVRLLRAQDPRIADQMLDLEPYRPVSLMPPVRRDLSIAVDQSLDVELLGDRVREVLGDDARSVEEASVLSATPYDDVPEPARERLGLRRTSRTCCFAWSCATWPARSPTPRPTPSATGCGPPFTRAAAR